MNRIKLATVWLGGCSGCHMSFLDLDEWLLELAQQVELVYSPLADVKTYPEGVDVALVEGAIANQDHLEMIRQVRDRTKFLISFGDCAITGNVTALRNPLSRSAAATENNTTENSTTENSATENNTTENSADTVLNHVYLKAFPETALQAQLPTGDLVPPLLPQVIPVHQSVDVDLYLPGCPPNADRIRAALAPLLAGKIPQLSGAEHIQFG